MKIFRNIYGVYGMVEWSTLIPTGGSNLRVDFTNGSINSRGIDPATFTTDVPGVQAAIENSPKYKSGKIKKVKSFVIGEIPDEVVTIEEEPKGSTSKSGVKSAAADDVSGNGTDGSNNNSAGDNGGASNPGDDNLGGSGETTITNGESGGEDNKFSDVKNSQQAKAILIGEPYNVPLADLGNKQAILDKAAELNVVFSNWK